MARWTRRRARGRPRSSRTSLQTSAYASAGRTPSYASTVTSAAFCASSWARMASIVSGDEPGLGLPVVGDVEPHRSARVPEQRLLSTLREIVEELSREVGHLHASRQWSPAPAVICPSAGAPSTEPGPKHRATLDGGTADGRHPERVIVPLRSIKRSRVETNLVRSNRGRPGGERGDNADRGLRA